MSGAQALATLGKLSYDEVKYLLAVEGKLKRLSTEHAWMHSFLQDAYHQQPQERVARLWIAEVRDLMYQVQDVIDTFNHKVASMRQHGFVGKLKRGVCSLREAWALHDIGLEIDELTTRLADLSRRAQTYGIQRSQPSDDHAIPSNRRQLFQPTSDANDLVGFEGYINELKGALCDENNPHYTAWVVLILGMGGTGKTALAKKICHHNDVRRHFKSFAWSNVSKQFKVKHVLQQIFIQLTSAKDQEKERILQSDEDELGKELSGLLESEKYLVILDDVWEDTDWEILKTIFPDKVRNPGSKILITSRNQEVASKDGPQATRRLG